jgi:hypothetical protein
MVRSYSSMPLRAKAHIELWWTSQSGHRNAVTLAMYRALDDLIVQRSCGGRLAMKILLAIDSSPVSQQVLEEVAARPWPPDTTFLIVSECLRKETPNPREPE